MTSLLEERNVTNAGRRIGLSQPAMSAALARLRRHFNDDLLSRKGGHYELTALGLALFDRTATACDLLERVFGSQTDFDPAREEHEFTLVSSDYAVAVFGAELVGPQVGHGSVGLTLAEDVGGHRDRLFGGVGPVLQPQRRAESPVVPAGDVADRVDPLRGTAVRVAHHPVVHGEPTAGQPLRHRGGTDRHDDHVGGDR
ncbi:DNA-binding transcriptional LysR family regulator [Nocardiopsis aegyptia]|uniref:DNA-binding transcriptional LysR family regulator n=1 Tax=Nocardiopsis aegyptia TaxID=220378 RepID=A0A7Z0EIA3_9ACTN|nr:LysR family transcriptional regulator [Nocardiopsis aegyptia]NYJ32573.1 DNA-binding transcriptional LysR family regulator [Nocardiopsis aegyptia]